MGGETHLLIVRHPEVESNVNGRFVGQGESPYTDLGRVQARRLPAKILAYQPAAIWTSPLLRARVVAERAARRGNVPLNVDERLLELDFGAAHALTWDEIQAAGIEFNYRSAERPVAPGGESRADLLHRVASLIDEVSAGGGRHAFVCHAGVMRAALAHTLQLADGQMWSFSIHSAQMAYVRLVDGVWLLEEFRQG